MVEVVSKNDSINPENANAKQYYIMQNIEVSDLSFVCL